MQPPTPDASWTQRLPTRAGWYWCKTTRDGEPEIDYYRRQDFRPLRDCWWQGPVKPNEEHDDATNP